MVYNNTTATVKADIVFNQQQSSTYSTSFTNLQGSLGYSIGMSGGSGYGLGQTDCIYLTAGYHIGSGQTVEYDFTALSGEAFGAHYPISMTGLKALVIRNHNTGEYEMVLLKATGTDAFTNIFRGSVGSGSGNISIEPGGAYLYSNPYYGLHVTDTNKKIQITNVGSGGTGIGSEWVGNTGIAVTLIAAGVSGTGYDPG